MIRANRFVRITLRIARATKIMKEKQFAQTIFGVICRIRANRRKSRQKELEQTRSANLFFVGGGVVECPPPRLCVPHFLIRSLCLGDLKITSTALKGQNATKIQHQYCLVIISVNSLVFSRKIIASTSFYWCCASDASAPVVVKNQSPSAYILAGASTQAWRP